MKRRAITTNNYHNNHPIMADSMMGYAADKNILSKIEEQFDYAEESKSKICPDFCLLPPYVSEVLKLAFKLLSPSLYPSE